MDDLRHLVALAVPAGSRVVAVAPDPPLLDCLRARDCRTWSVVDDDSAVPAVRGLSEGVAVCDPGRPDLAEAFPGIDVDVVVLMGALASVALPAELLQGVTKLLTTDGRLVASVPNATHVSRRLRSWDGLGEDDEVGPGWPPRRAFTGRRVQQLMTDNGLSVVETLRVRGGASADGQPAWLPPAVLSFLEADEDAGTDHYVIVASPAGRMSPDPVSVAEDMQRRLHDTQRELAERQADLATLERELEALQLDLALKDDFTLDVRGQMQAVERRAAALESELVEVRASLDVARHQLVEHEQEAEHLRRLARRGMRSLLLDRITERFGRGRPTQGTADPPT